MIKEMMMKKQTINIILWIVQVFLSVTLIWAGAMKFFQPGELPWPWVKENPGLVTLSAIFDVLAGLGLVLPGLLRVQPKLTIYAAYGTIALMIAASIFHMTRGESHQIGFNILILVLATFVVWGRQKK